MNETVPHIAFLGICDRSAEIRVGHPIFWKHNILGLGRGVLSNIFPMSLGGAHLALAIYDISRMEKSRISLVSPAGEEEFHLDFDFENSALPHSPPHPAEIGVMVPATFPVWSFVMFDLGNINASVKRPGEHRLVLRSDRGEREIGSIEFHYVPAPPLTEERIAAIRSNPHAAKAIRYSVQCNFCNDKLLTYAGLSRIDKQESEGWVWYKDLPDSFICGCGKSVIDLTMLRESGHAYLGHIGEGEVSFIRLYEKGSLDAVAEQFAALLDSRPKEETIQRFFQENPLLFHQFSPEKIHNKAPILTKHASDFAILSKNGVLFLVEIEKADGRLLRKDGGRSAALQHAFDQVRDWLDVFDKHRAAALECIGLKPEEVVTFRGVVVMGRDSGHNSEHLSRLKGEDHGRVTFFTYDDLLGALVGLVRHINEL